MSSIVTTWLWNKIYIDTLQKKEGKANSVYLPVIRQTLIIKKICNVNNVIKCESKIHSSSF